VTVELKPETERLVQEEIQRGHFHSVDELIVQGVTAWREKHQAASPLPIQARKRRKNLADFLLESPFAGSELIIERQKDYPRPVDLS
jgi:Arc/MetJ-type ribon-helix-helix transcriptional regulator